MKSFQRVLALVAFHGMATLAQAQSLPVTAGAMTGSGLGEVGGMAGAGANIIQICQCIENQPVSNCQQLANNGRVDPNRAVPNSTPAGHTGTGR